MFVLKYIVCYNLVLFLRYKNIEISEFLGTTSDDVIYN